MPKYRKWYGFTKNALKIDAVRLMILQSSRFSYQCESNNFVSSESLFTVPGFYERDWIYKTEQKIP